MRRAAKVDANQARVVAALRAVGASVESLAATGKGVPDLLIGYKGVNYLAEVKDGDKVKSAQKLTPHQVVWHESWLGSVCTVRSPTEAVEFLMAAEQKRHKGVI